MIWLAVAALCGLSLYLRCGNLNIAFPPDGINFLETDAWYHVRSIDHLVRNFPHRMSVDPYSTLRYQEELATGPMFDYLVATVAWIAGLGHPSEHLVHLIAAWMPAIFGMLIVPVVFLLAQEAFGVTAGLFAAATIATMPGHFLGVGLVGYTDHHVLESLLAALFFWLLLRAVSQKNGFVLSGIALGAYLLTFVGGAFLVGAVLVCMFYEQIRARWSRGKDLVASGSIRPLLLTFAIALAMVLPFHRTLWMGYTIATLCGGAALISAVQFWSSRIKSQLVFFAGLIGVTVLAAAVTIKVAPNAFRIVYRLAPSFVHKSEGVAELRSLFFENGSFTWRVAWIELGAALPLAILGLVLLAEAAIRRPDFRRNLIFIWAFITFVITAGQIRMTYYFAVAAALVCGYVIDSLLRSAPRFRLAIAATAVAFVFVPDFMLALDVNPGEVAGADWRATCAWLRRNTPEPFGDSNHYYVRYAPGTPEASYSVMAWWDYGYWITALARRVPVANPTQINADVAASVLLARDENEAAEIMERWTARYLLVDQSIPMLADEDTTAGKFPNLFPWARDRSVEDYYLIASERGADGDMKRRVLFRPAYFQSMLVRLFMFGGRAVEKPTGIALAYLRVDGAKREITDLREFVSEESARAAEKSCRLQGCLIVSTSPYRSCVRLEPVTRFREIYSSPTKAVQTDDGNRRSAVQVYEFQ